jgi:hypothetical protein
VLGAELDFFCLNLDTGKPSRFPSEFTECYAPLPEVVAAYSRLEDRLSLGHWPR